ncbi:MAG: hypothetical protein CVT94_07475 [Bacteroidetes bacterium HGW-Bacteroidetes-11]|jgi:hypothetical protein|nr:MAG: hypothetical protein CVT94_07475 [Bacteroidetes bacterium HGW-Bacteroidetes-11]
MDGWTCVYTTSFLHEAELVKGMLEENQITAFLINKQDSVYLFGDIEVHVSTDNAFTATQLINNRDRE